MKRPDNTEMDRLLRRQARLGGAATPRVESGAASASAHLDADEMSAYAEGALPEAARTHYFAHLADCDNCRKLVTELTLAANVAGQGRESAAAETKTAPSKSWREWLAAIFSPPVLRYAVPALALSAVVIIALVAMRAQRDGSFVARNEQSRSTAGQATAPNTNLSAPSTTANVQNHADPAPTPLAETPGEAQPGAPPVTSPPANAPAPTDVLTPAETTSARPGEAQTEDSQTVAREAEQARSAAREEADSAPAPPPAPQPTAMPAPATPAADETGARDKREEPKRAKTAGKDDTDEAPIGASRTTPGGVIAKTESDGSRNDAGGVAASRAPRGRAQVARKSGPANTGGGNERTPETRNIGGRSFQRRDGAWVDTAYNTSRPTTNVRRGSDQYRALVADEPPLRTFAEQLGGEVIVVWKSRAYRFY